MLWKEALSPLGEIHWLLDVVFLIYIFCTALRQLLLLFCCCFFCFWRAGGGGVPRHLENRCRCALLARLH